MSFNSTSSKPGSAPLKTETPQVLTLADKRQINTLAYAVATRLISMKDPDYQGAYWSPNHRVMRDLAVRIESSQLSMSKEQTEAFAEALGVAIRIECEQFRVPEDTLEMFFALFIKDMEIKAAK